jgi:hypothetical protein
MHLNNLARYSYFKNIFIDLFVKNEYNTFKHLKKIISHLRLKLSKVCKKSFRFLAMKNQKKGAKDD